MPTPKSPQPKSSRAGSPRTREISPSDREFDNLAQRLTRRALSRYPGFAHLELQIATDALNSLLRAQKRTDILNVEAFLTWKINRLILDALRRRKVEKSRFEEKPDVAHDFDNEVPRARPQGRGGIRGLSMDIINREEQEAINLAASAAVLVLPDADDQALLADWYFEGLTVAELSDRHGNGNPRAMANRLARLIGSPANPGAVSSVVHVMQELSVKTGLEFVGQIHRLRAIELMTDPFATAIGHLELAATNSAAHRRQAALGIARLTWLKRNLPSNRGLSNQVLRRLVVAACAYVIEVNDARPDHHSELGLHDDVQVLSAVHKAVKKFARA